MRRAGALRGLLELMAIQESQNSSPLNTHSFTALATNCSSLHNDWIFSDIHRAQVSSLRFLLSKEPSAMNFPALSISISHRSTTVFLQDCSFLWETRFRFPAITSRHGWMVSSSAESVATAKWYSRNAVISRQDGWAPSGVECNIQSLCETLEPRPIAAKKETHPQ